MKILIENWRKYLIKEGNITRYAELPDEWIQIVREELQNIITKEGTRREKHSDTDKPPFSTLYRLEPILWRAGQNIRNVTTTAFHNVKNRIKKEYSGPPEQRWSVHTLVAGAAKEIFELYDRIGNIEDEETKNKIEEMIFSPSGLGWFQALEILKSIQG